MSAFTTVFDVASTPIHTQLVFAVIAAIAAAALFLAIRSAVRTQLPGKRLTAAGIAFAAFVALGIVGWMLAGQQWLLFNLKSGHCQIVEGMITDFSPMPLEGHAEEHFTVAGHYFEYSDFDIRPGFHQSQSRGGPLRAGVYVRIYYLKNEIARIETRKQ